MEDLSERDRLREQHAAAAGTGHLIEQLLGQRENLAAYGQPTEAVDAQLAHLGYADPATRSKQEAAASRRAAAAEAKAAGDDAPESKPPAGRRAPRRTGTATARGKATG